MKNLFFLVSSSFDDFKRNKVRTFLTSLGIMIGVLSVVLLIAFGQGLKNYIKEQFESIGTNLVYVLPGRIVGEGGGFRDPGSLGAKFEEKDVLRLKKVENVDYVVPVFEKSVTVTAGANREISQLLASTHEIALALNLEPEIGNFFTKSDLEKRAKVAAIGPKLAEKLFGSKDNAYGKTIRVSNQSFKVIAVLKSKGGGALGGPNFDTITYIPYKTSLRINPDKKFYALYLRARTDTNIAQVKKDAEKVLLKTYDKDEFQVVEQTEFLNIITSIFSVLNGILIAIGSISLIVGGIGIMNIMYATVTERIKEIGIRRAIGATKKDILFQFLAQAIILSLSGGIIGLIFAFVIVFFVRQIFPAEINLISVIVAFFISSGIGIVFGVFPARRASNLVPIEAIRYE